MTEREMEDLLWEHPEKLLNEPLRQFRRQPSSQVGRADLVFVDRCDRLLVVELKLGRLPRGAVDQLHDYFGMLKREFPNRPVELMVVANHIPEERRLACDRLNIECREISEKKFRDLAIEVGYVFRSGSVQAASAGSVDGVELPTGKTGWKFQATIRPWRSDPSELLGRCDEPVKSFYAALFERQENEQRTRFTFDHESGFSMQFNFPDLGFVEILWGFPHLNRAGKPSKNAGRLVLPLDFAAKRGVPISVVESFAAELDRVAGLVGSGKRPKIDIAALSEGDRARLIDAIFDFANRGFARAADSKE